MQVSLRKFIRRVIGDQKIAQWSRKYTKLYTTSERVAYKKIKDLNIKML